MDRRKVLLIVAALIAALGTAVVFLYVRGADSRANLKFAGKQVLVASAAISPGESLKVAKSSGKIETKTVTAGSLVPGYVTDLAAIPDENVALTTIYPGEQILRVFAAGDFLAAAGERDLLGQRLALAPEAQLGQQVMLRDREWTVEEIELTLQGGLGFRAGLDQATAALLASLDGKRTLAEVAAELARVQGASRESVAQAALPVAREMLGAGFLERIV